MGSGSVRGCKKREKREKLKQLEQLEELKKIEQLEGQLLTKVDQKMNEHLLDLQAFDLPEVNEEVLDTEALLARKNEQEDLDSRRWLALAKERIRKMQNDREEMTREIGQLESGIEGLRKEISELRNEPPPQLSEID